MALLGLKQDSVNLTKSKGLNWFLVKAGAFDFAY